MSNQERDAGEVTEVAPSILRDLESRHTGTICPVHGVPPKFEVDEKGGVVESFCCDALLQIFRELSAREDQDAASEA